MSEMSLDQILAAKKSEAEGAEPEAKEGPTLIYSQQVLAERGKSSVGVYELPLGYIDTDGTRHTEFTIREMTGAEEDLLSNDKVSMQTRMNKLLENCLLSVGPYQQKTLGWSEICLSLTRLDRLWIMLQVRILTLGPVFTAKVKCASEDCGKYSTQNIDLQDLHVKNVDDPTLRTYEGTLPKSGLSYKAKIWTGHDETRMEKQVSKMPGDIISVILATRLLQLGEAKAPIAIQRMKDLPLLDRQHLRSQVAKKEGELDRSMECVCSHCGHEFTENIEIFTGSFFFPSET